MLREGVSCGEPVARQSTGAAWHRLGFNKNLNWSKDACSPPPAQLARPRCSHPDVPPHCQPAATEAPRSPQHPRRGEGWLLYSSWYKEELKHATSARCRELPDREATVAMLCHSTCVSFAPRMIMTPELWCLVPSLPPPSPKAPLPSLKSWTCLLMMPCLGRAVFSSCAHFSGLTANPAPS